MSHPKYHQMDRAHPRMNSKKLYIYNILRTSNAIRLLWLEPGRGGDPLRGDLHRTELCDATGFTPDFEALSYVWGKADYTHTLQTSRGIVRITSNLAQALRRLRLTDRIRHIWADAVCIDQADPAERGQQVKMMGNIYSSARCVLVWLGPDPELKARRIFNMALNPGQAATVEGFKDLKAAVADLSACQWFSRLWVVQEYLLARSRICMWGDEEIDFDHLRGPLYSVPMANGHATHWINLQRHSVMSVSNVLSCTRGMHCADERDRVYAIQGLPHNKDYQPNLIAQLQCIQPDYTRTVSQTVLEFAKAFVSCSETYKLLAHVCHGRTIESRLRDRPSWVPNLRSPNLRSPTTNEYKPLRMSRGNGLGSRRIRLPRPDEISVSTHALNLEGYLETDSIRTLGPSPSSESKASSLESIATFWGYYIHTAHTQRTSSQYRKYERLFLQVLMCRTWDPMVSVDWRALEAAIFPPASPPRIRTASNRAKKMLKSLERSASSRRDYLDLTTFFPPQRYWKQRRLIMTAKGNAGMAPLATEVGDIVASFPQFDMPLVLRPRKGYFHFVGVVFISETERVSSDEYRVFEIH